MIRMKWFCEKYISKNQRVRILDVGSYDINGSVRNLFSGSNIEYIGMDVTKGPNVDYVPKDPYNWTELSDDSFDYVISLNAFEHIEFPWVTIKQIQKKLKTGGITCIIAPNSTNEHKFPVDCYRYFSDGLIALAKWGGLTVIDCKVAGIPEISATSEWDSYHNDAMLVAIKGKENIDISNFPVFKYERRFLHACEWEKRYRFLVKWIKDGDISLRIKNFFEINTANQIYIYGYGEIGKLLCKQLELNGFDYQVIDKNNKMIIDIQALSIEDKIDEGPDSLMICSLLNIGIIEELQMIYRHIKIFSIMDIFQEAWI